MIQAPKFNSIVVQGPPGDGIVISKINCIVVCDTTTIVDPGTLPTVRRRVQVSVHTSHH